MRTIRVSQSRQFVRRQWVETFWGQGPARLEDGTINPLATGALLSDANVGLIKLSKDGEDKYALNATGTISIVGVNGLTVQGTASVQFNNTGYKINEEVSVTGSNKDPITVKFEDTVEIKDLKVTGADLDVLGQSISGDFSFSDNQDSLMVYGSNITMQLGSDGAGAVLNEGEGVILLSSGGAAIDFSGQLKVNAPELILLVILMLFRTLLRGPLIIKIRTMKINH